MKILLLLAYLASWALIPHLLLLKKRPAATLAWLWAILLIPVLGALAYVAIGTDRLSRQQFKRRGLFSAHDSRQSDSALTGDGAIAALLTTLPSRSSHFFQLLTRINQLPVSSVHALRILANAEEFYPALAARIATARHHIHLVFYIWQNDATGRQFLQLLIVAARRGVAVRLLLDGVGSPPLPADLLAEFRRAGGQFSWFQSLAPSRYRFFLNLRNHRKLQLIDGDTAFVGGMNIGDEHKSSTAVGGWRDVQVEVAGAVVNELQEVFSDDWFFSTGEKIIAPAYYPTVDLPPQELVQVVLGGPDRRNEPLSKSLVSLLNEATSRVWIATGYFVPDDILLAALELAAQRGVDVRLLISAQSDHPGLVTIGRSFYGELLAAGVRLFEYSVGIYHSKVALADTDWGMIGSANLDYRSMRLNFELNLLFHSPIQNAVLSNLFAADFLLCQEIQTDVFARRPFRQKFSEAAFRPLAPML